MPLKLSLCLLPDLGGFVGKVEAYLRHERGRNEARFLTNKGCVVRSGQLDFPNVAFGSLVFAETSVDIRLFPSRITL